MAVCYMEFSTLLPQVCGSGVIEDPRRVCTARNGPIRNKCVYGTGASFSGVMQTIRISIAITGGDAIWVLANCVVRRYRAAL